MSESKVRSVEQYLAKVRQDSSAWPAYQPGWFRGEPTTETPLLPSLYRGTTAPHENQLLQMFRAMAPAFSPEPLPDREKTDQWLFLARHVGLPTRLLDWSEAALFGLYFALRREDPRGGVVWMLNPLQLNHFARGAPSSEDPATLRKFDVPWHRPAAPRINAAFENIRGAWEEDGPGVPLPVAVYPSYIHARLRAQRAGFTVHGKKKVGLASLVTDTILVRYEIDMTARVSMLGDLRTMGVTESAVFPDLDGLARDLRDRFS